MTEKIDISQCLTVQELKELLEDYPEKMPVVFGYNFGDYWHTNVLAQVKSLETGRAEYSDYHQMLKEVDHIQGTLNEEEEDQDEENPENVERIDVLVLR